MAELAAAAPVKRTFLESLGQSRGGLGVLFLLPAAAILLIFLTYPLGLGVWLAFTDTKIGRLESEVRSDLRLQLETFQPVLQSYGLSA